jgi:hypothetical protein
VTKKKRKKRAVISRAEVLRRVEEILRLLDTNVHIAMAVEAAMESANELIKGRPPIETYTGHAYKTISDSLAMWLAITLARIYDIGKKHPKNRQDKASIPLLLHLLGQRRCQGILLLRARNWTPRMNDIHEKTCRGAIQGALSAYASMAKTTAGRRATDRLRQFRDRRLAHTLRQKTDALPTYSDLFLLVATARAVLQHATLAIDGRHFDLDAQQREYRNQADAFWAPALSAVFASEPKFQPRV